MSKLFPRFYDQAMAPLEKMRFQKIRSSLVGQAAGKVLEIGSGTGINFPYYKNADHVDAIEPNPVMMAQTGNRLRQAKVPISTHLAKAEKLPFADQSFDTIVATLVFCTIPDPLQALEEIKRVSKPGADFLLLEHVRMDQKAMGKAQDILTPLWSKVCDGCHLNRDTVGLLQQSGIAITKVEAYYGGLFLAIEGKIEKG